MTSMILYITFIPLLAMILLGINLIFAPHNPYQEKSSTFECGFHSFLGQNRTQFSISFFVFALLFLLFDLEILLVYPYVVSSYTNDIYGLIIMLIFFLVLTLGFTFELGKNALKIDSRQVFNIVKKELSFVNKKSDFLVCLVFTSSIMFWLALKLTQWLTSNLKTYMFDILYELYYCTVIAILLIGTLFFIGSSLIWLNVVDFSLVYDIEPLYMNDSGPGAGPGPDTGVGAGPSEGPSAGPGPTFGPGPDPSAGSSAGTNTNPLDSYPEYQQVNNLDEIYGIKREVLAIKQEVTDRLWFRTPQIYIDQLNGLTRYASRPNPHRSSRQVRDLERHFEDARSGLEWATKERAINLRTYAESNHRLEAIVRKIIELGGDPNG